MCNYREEERREGVEQGMFNTNLNAVFLVLVNNIMNVYVKDLKLLFILLFYLTYKKKKKFRLLFCRPER